MKKPFIVALLFLLITAFSLQEKTDARAEKLLNQFMKALMIEDFDASAKAVMKFTHKSLHNSEGTNLTSDLLRFSFKKAHDNAKFYAQPVKITRVRKTNVTAIGFKETAQKGTVYDYFIAKKDGGNGLPAPVKIFFPEDGSEPLVSYMGSL